MTCANWRRNADVVTRNIFCYFFLQSDNVLTHQTTKNLKMVRTRNSNLGIEQMSELTERLGVFEAESVLSETIVEGSLNVVLVPLQ